ncbi:MAG: DNA polymerase III subunit delta [Candidatus Peribacteraceae bacterium]|nr:DNA polymerase III subunit delta [Candidatus Peribacteraceae bacterium]MDD5074597.1 DNA polymerase III subunit delta [Candidatus Peribacteraceae bacterium]
MGNLFLFTGENTFLLGQELSRWVKEFREKHGEENLARRDGKAISVVELMNEISTAPFIAEKRLIVLDGLPAFTKEDLKALLAGMHPQVLLLIVDPKPDKRLAVTKEIMEQATVKEFRPLQRDAVLQWMRTYLPSLGGSADNDALSLLMDFAGEDQLVLSQELLKLTLHACGKPITRADVEELVFPSSERTVWRMMDLLGEGRGEDAVHYARTLLLRGESPHSIWNMLLWMLASLTEVVGAVESGTTAPLSIVQATGVKFGTVRALLPLARRCKSAHLQSILSQAVEADIALKTGAYRATTEGGEELETLIDRCLLAFSCPTA